MKKLKLLRKQKGLSQAETAELLGITQSAYSRYESGQRQPDLDILKKIAKIYNVSVDDLLIQPPEETFGRQIVEQPVPVFEDEVMLPIVASLRCGYGASGEPYVTIGEHGVPKSFVKKYGREIVLNYASGESMIPTIRPNDLMVCYPSSWWDDGMIVIVNVNDSDTVKRIYHAKDGGIDLIPENPNYASMHYTPEQVKEYKIAVLAHVLTTIPPEITPIPRRE
jgi:transcriptional regulator with XRE-family HTH domain